MTNDATTTITAAHGHKYLKEKIMPIEKEAPDYWSFSLAVYGHPEIEQACLTLQNSLQLNINVLLIALFATRRLGRSLTLREIREGDQEIFPWHKAVVEPLREIRIQLKKGPAPAPRSDTENLRNLIKSAELSAEFIEQSVLTKWIQSLPDRMGSQEPDIYMLTATRVVDFYACENNYAVDRVNLRRQAQIVAEVAALSFLAP